MPYLTPEAPVDTWTLLVTVPDTLMPSVTGALVSLWNPYHWEQFGTLTVPQTLELVGDMITSLQENPSVGFYPHIINVPYLFPAQYNTQHDRLLTSNVIFNVRLAFVGGNGAYATYPLLLQSGIWSMDICTSKEASQSIHQYLIDGTEVGTYDAYAAGLTWNVYYTLSNISVATSGIHNLTVKANGKNAASGGYGLCINALVMTRTGDLP